MFKKVNHVHFVGIAGVGMAGIAEVLLNLNYKVSGSDLKANETSRRLEALGATIHYGHSHDNIENPSVCVYSSAISIDNVEISECKKRFIPVISRGEMLAELMRLKHGVVVSGSHGKTTITSMIGTILTQAHLDPTVILGGKLSTYGSGVKLGEGELFVAEIDESDGSFLKVDPTIGVISSIDKEHLNFYGSMENMKDAFIKFSNKVPFYGAIIFCLDDKYIQELVPFFEKRHISYGLSQQAEIKGKNLEFDKFSSSFTIYNKALEIGRIKLQIPGFYNVLNALAAWAVATELEVEPSIIKSALEEFKGADRRFQVKGKYKDMLIIEDYAHHPTAIKCVLNAAKVGFSKKIIAVCQPHRYTRVQDLLSEFTTSFYDADIVFITEIYSAGESIIPNLSGKTIASEIKKHGHREVYYISDISEIPGKISEIVKGDEIVIFLGAGDIYKSIDGLIELLEKDSGERVRVTT
jgi:UDP-N-acetylmuramate--alanine ligase